MSENERPPKAPYELNNERAHIAAYVLIAGLVLEIVAAFIWYHGTETLVTIAATLLIVLGVWGEVFFGNKAREAGDAEVVEYRKRAAEAEKATAEAQLKIEELRSRMSPRRLDGDMFMKALEGKPRGRIEIWFVRDDIESYELAMQIRNFLGMAGWAKTEPCAIPPTSSPRLAGYPSTTGAGGQPSGVTIVVNLHSRYGVEMIKESTSRDRAMEPNSPFSALRQAFSAGLGGVATSGNTETAPLELDVMRIVVGSKPTAR